MLTLAQRETTRRSADVQVRSCVPDGDRYRVEVSDTVLYPEGGGQPADHGTLAGVQVVDSQRRDGKIFHWTTEPVSVGAAQVVVDWERRFDHMQQHTAQHLITAIAEAELGRKTLAFHLKPDRCDIELSAPPLTSAEVVRLQELLRAAILTDRPVTPRVIARDALEASGVRTRGIDPSIREVRVVSIEGVDDNACGGTHVGRLGQLEQVLLLHTEKTKAGCRLFYLAGGRALAWARGAYSRERELNQALRCGPIDHLAAVGRLQSEAKDAARMVRKLVGELAERQAAELATGDAPVAAFVGGADLRVLGTMARVITDGKPNRRVLLGGDGVFLLSGPDEWVSTHGPSIAAELEGKGGGRGGRYQGKAARPERVDSWADKLAGLN